MKKSNRENCNKLPQFFHVIHMHIGGGGKNEWIEREWIKTYL